MLEIFPTWPDTLCFAFEWTPKATPHSILGVLIALIMLVGHNNIMSVHDLAPISKLTRTLKILCCSLFPK